MRRPPRQARIRTTHRVQQAAAAKAREARHGGGTSFPPVDMLVYDDSDGEDEDDEGHDDLAADESRSSTSDDTDADDRGNLREQRMGIMIKVRLMCKLKGMTAAHSQACVPPCHGPHGACACCACCHT